MRLNFGRATDFEFRYRFWLIAAAYWFSFALYAVDPRNVASVFVHTNLGFHLVFAAATFIVLLAAVLRSWASAYLNSNVVHDLNLHSDRLVADGPYRFTRNPLYVGSILFSLGIATMASRLGFLVITSAMFVFVYRLIAREESQLLREQRESFVTYCAAVPRFWPALRPRVPSSGKKPNWANGIAGELVFSCFAIAMGSMAITLNP